MRIRIEKAIFEDAQRDEKKANSLNAALLVLKSIGKWNKERYLWDIPQENVERLRVLDELGIGYEIIGDDIMKEGQSSAPIIMQLQDIQERLKRIEQRIESMTPLDVDDNETIEFSRPYDSLLNMVKENPAVADIAEISNLPDKMKKSISSIASSSLNQKEQLSDDEVLKVRFLVHMIISQLSFEDDIRIQRKIDEHLNEYIDFCDKKGLGGTKMLYKNWSILLKEEFLGGKND